MYDSCTAVELCECSGTVLSRFSAGTARSITSCLVTELVKGLNSSNGKTILTTDAEVMWCMEVLSYGLSMSFASDYSTVRDCVRICCDWFTCVSEEPNSTVPCAVLTRPTYYVKELIKHVLQLFYPKTRDGTGSDAIIKQAKECHYVLRSLQSVVLKCKRNLEHELWPEVLRFLLSVNDALLSGPFDSDDISSQLCERVLSTLFDLWLAACARDYFPAPAFWRRLKELCTQWRHHPPLVEHWIRLTMALTAEVVSKPIFSSGVHGLSTYNAHPLPKGLLLMVDVVTQCWFRVLYLIGSPADLFSPLLYMNVASNFRHLQSSQPMSNYSDHSCLQMLPYILFRYIHGISLLISLLLDDPFVFDMRYISQTLNGNSALSNPVLLDVTLLHDKSLATPTTSTPSLLSAGSKSGSSSVPRPSVGFSMNRSSFVPTTKDLASAQMKVAFNAKAPPSDGELQSVQNSASHMILTALSGRQQELVLNPCLSPLRSSVDTLLNLFGDWLFTSAAAHVPTTPSTSALASDDALSVKSDASHHSAFSDNISLESKSLSSHPDSRHLSDVSTSSTNLTAVEAARAELISCLFKIFCSKKTTEKLSRIYVSRFLAVISDAFRQCDKMIIASLLLSGVNIYRVNLEEAYILLPLFLNCMETTLRETVRSSRYHPSISKTDLRRAILYILCSLTSVPFQFSRAVLPLLNSHEKISNSSTLQYAWPMFRMLFEFVRNETDGQNLQIALAIGAVYCRDYSHFYSNNTGSDQDLVSAGSVVRQFCSTILECVRDNTRWLDEYSVCLSAIETLLMLSDLIGQFDDNIIAQASVGILCQLVELQLARPPPAHSRDLHTVVVMAYIAIGYWMVNLPQLLCHRPTVDAVTRVIELGMLGKKIEADIHPVEPKPASQRVRDAAEQLLLSIATKPACGFRMLEDRLDEVWVKKSLLKNSDAAPQFSYFIAENSALFAVATIALPQNESADGNARDSLVIIMRTCMGTDIWLADLEFQPQDQSPSTLSISGPSGVDKPPLKQPLFAYYPAEVDKIPSSTVNFVPPPMIFTDDHELIRSVYRRFVAEKDLPVAAMPAINNLRAVPPRPAVSWDPFRTLFHDLGLLRSENFMHDTAQTSKFTSLNADSPQFVEELSELDCTSDRLCLTSFCFYVKSGCCAVQDLLANGDDLKRNTSAKFCRFLRLLGQTVQLKSHRQWSGAYRPYNVTNGPSSGLQALSLPASTEKLAIDGINKIVYWGDLYTELAVILPSSRSHYSVNLTVPDNSYTERSRAQSSPKDSDAHLIPVPVPPPRSKSLSHQSATMDSEDSVTLRVPNANGSGIQFSNSVLVAPENVDRRTVLTKSVVVKAVNDWRIFIVWLEDYEDLNKFPLCDAISATGNSEYLPVKPESCIVLFIHPLGSGGLYRLTVKATWSRLGCPSPVVDGSVIREAVLPLIVRQMIISIGRRRKLEQEGFQLAYLKRRQKIIEHGQKFGKRDLKPNFVRELVAMKSLHQGTPAGVT